MKNKQSRMEWRQIRTVVGTRFSIPAAKESVGRQGMGDIFMMIMGENRGQQKLC